MNISGFVIGLVLVGAVVAVMGLFYANVADNYAVSYDNTTFSSYDKLRELNNVSEQMKDTISTVKPSSNPLDVLGGFLASGYQVIKTSWLSFNIFTDITNDGFDKMGNEVGGEGFGIIMSSLRTIVLLLFVFGVIAILVSRDKL